MDYIQRKYLQYATTNDIWNLHCYYNIDFAFRRLISDKSSYGDIIALI
jgi:hypothetical protein